MKVNESKMKYYTKYKVNSASILDDRAKNKAISVFLILKIPFFDTLEGWNFRWRSMGVKCTAEPDFKSMPQIL